MVSVRRAAENDAYSIRAIMETADVLEPVPEEQFRDAFESNLNDPKMIHVVAEINGAVAGYGSMSFSVPLSICRPVAEIRELAVDGRGRGKGAGALLVNAMMLLARDRGCCRLEVCCHRLAKRDQHFYSKHGFVLANYKLTMDIGFKAE